MLPNGRNYTVNYGVKSYIYTLPTGRNCAVCYWRKILQNIYYGLEEITPLVTSVKSYRYTLSAGRNYAVSYWRKILQYIQYRMEKITYLSF